MQSKINDKANFGYNFNLSQYLSEGWAVLQQNFLPFFGFSILAGIIGYILAFIPIIGGLASAFIVTPALTLGYYLVANKIRNRQEFTFNNFFDGFNKIGPLALYTLIFFALILLGLLVIATVLGGFIAGMSRGDGNMGGAIFSIILMVLIIFLGLSYFIVSYCLTNQFIGLGNLEAWQAMEASRKVTSKNFFNFLLLFFIFFLIYCFIGSIVTLLVGGAAFSTISGLMQNPDLGIMSIISLITGLSLVILLVNAVIAPFYHNTMHAAFRDIMDLDRNIEPTETITDHLIED